MHKMSMFELARKGANMTMNKLNINDEVMALINDIDSCTYNITAYNCKEFVGPDHAKEFKTYEEYLHLLPVEKLGILIVFASIAEIETGIPLQLFLMAKIQFIVESNR